MFTLFIGFSRPKKDSIISKIIQIVDHRNFSHTYASWHDTLVFRDLVYQASPQGVMFENAARFMADNDVVARFAFSLTDDQMMKVMQLCVDFAGYAYGFKQIAGIAWVHFCRIFGKKVTNPFSDDTGTMVCSEVVYRILEIICPELLVGLDSDIVTPGDLYGRISASFSPVDG